MSADLFRLTRNARFWWLLAVILACGLGICLRFQALGSRPMHTDEAVHGLKLLELLRTGAFDYDPRDFHGPTLHFSSQFLGWIAGWGEQDWTEARLRLVPAIYGTALFLTFLIFRSALGMRAVAVAMMLTALSPFMVFYSRYYIMEALFVCYNSLFLGALWKLLHSGGQWRWAVLAGILTGLMHATKETFVFQGAALAAAFLAAHLPFFNGSRSWKLQLPGTATHWWKMLGLLLLVAAVTSAVLFSSFFQSWPDVRESYATYGMYAQRAGGVGHEKPWWYYFALLAWQVKGVRWSEGLTVILALFGMWRAFFPRDEQARAVFFCRVLSFYTLALFVIYALVPYKTPWSIMVAYHGLLLLAGKGFFAVWDAFSTQWARIVLGALFCWGLVDFWRQNERANGIYSANVDRNPFVYAHTSTDCVALARQILAYTQIDPRGQALPVAVMHPEMAWPLPWYWRELNRAGYWPDLQPSVEAAVMVIEAEKFEAFQQMSGEEKLGRYHWEIRGLQSGKNLVVLTETALWDAWVKSRSRPAS